MDMTNNLLYVTMSLLGLSAVIVIWFIININDLKRNHEELKSELGQRLFVKTQVGNFDLKQILGALLTYHKVKIEGCSAIRVVKDKNEGK